MIIIEGTGKRTAVSFDGNPDLAPELCITYECPDIDGDGTCDEEECSDIDGDGICDADDCAPENADLPTIPGIACDDNDPSTVNDVILDNGCDCAGTFDPCVLLGGDTDGDGICDADDCGCNYENQESYNWTGFDL